MTRSDTQLPAGRLLRAFRACAAIGLLTLLAGLLFSTDRTLRLCLMLSEYLVGLGLAGLVVIAIQYASGASWGVAIRRVPEAMVSALPILAAVLLLTLVAGSSLYPWAHEPHGGPFKSWWLSWPFFLGRSAAYLGVWILFGAAIVRGSRAQDADGDAGATARNRRLSAAFLVVFGLTFSLACFDWTMSLEPEWYSTIFPVYNFAGLVISGLAVVTLGVIWLRSPGGPLELVATDEHLHDLGKLLFAFSSFWMYLWFSQYMLIWYANIPEESVYYVRRLSGAWGPLFVVNVLLNWAVPFFTLLRRDTKRRADVLAKVAVVMLVAQWLDRYLMVMPGSGAGPGLGLWEAGLTAGAVGVFGILFARGLRRAPAVPVGDPWLPASLHYTS